MVFFSLNQNSPKASFKEALLAGLAPDGGLYYPESIPKFTADEIKNFDDNVLAEVGYKILVKWLDGEMTATEIRRITTQALNFEIPLRKVGNFFVLELFHGPSLAFKDVAARVLALLMSKILGQENKQAIILTATSGDTGGAVAHGFGGLSNIKVVVLYPGAKVSRLQEEQLTRVSNNVFSLEVSGVFDDCQALVKRAFVDQDLKIMNLSSANSISVGRLIPQIIYYIYAYLQLKQTDLEFVVPCGNFGNLCAGIFAREMGLPFNKFVAVNNINDAVFKYYQTGEFKPQATKQTMSSAMDIGYPSNFIRILQVFNHNYEAFKRVIKVARATDKETVETIKKVFTRYGYLLDPHTAVAWHGAEQIGDNGCLKVILSTASPVKFADIIEQKTGLEVDDSQAIKELKKNKKRKIKIKNDYEQFKKILLSLPR